MKKTCTKCKAEKPISEFNKRAGTRDGLQSLCRPCSNYESREHYRRNKEKYKKRARKRNKRMRNKNKRNVMRWLLSAACADCGISDIRVLEFDHVSDDKTANVSDLSNMAYSWSTVKREIEKCEVVCANCHRVRHYERGSFPTASRLVDDVMRENKTLIEGDELDSTMGHEPESSDKRPSQDAKAGSPNGASDAGSIPAISTSSGGAAE